MTSDESKARNQSVRIAAAMTHLSYRFWVSAIFLAAVSLACGGSPVTTPTSPPSPSPNLQATVEAAMIDTSQAQAAIQATVEAAVAATGVAMPPTITPGPMVQYVDMTEEELESLIDQAVNEAVAAATQASTASTQATSDNAVSQQEVDSIQVVVTGAEEAIAYAEVLIKAYTDLYGELAVETLVTLQEIEDDLEEISASLAAISQTLIEIENVLSQGQAVSQATIEALETAAQQAASGLEVTQNTLQSWLKDTKTGRDDRANQYLSVKPDSVPTDLRSSLAAAFAFLDEVKFALGDKKITRDELVKISQLGANASAGMSQHGELQFQAVPSKINEIIGKLARGQVPHVRQGLGDFEKLLGVRPPDLPHPIRP